MQRCNATLVPHAVGAARGACHLVAVPARGKTRRRTGRAPRIACRNFCHREALVAATRGARVDPAAWRLPPLADDRPPAFPCSRSAPAADSRVADRRSSADRRPEAGGRARAGARATAAARTGRRRAMISRERACDDLFSASLAWPSGCAGLSPPSILDQPVGRFCRRGRAREKRRRRNEWRHPWKTASSSSAMTPASAPWR